MLVLLWYYIGPPGLVHCILLAVIVTHSAPGTAHLYFNPDPVLWVNFVNISSVLFFCYSNVVPSTFYTTIIILLPHPLPHSLVTLTISLLGHTHYLTPWSHPLPHSLVTPTTPLLGHTHYLTPWPHPLPHSLATPTTSLLSHTHYLTSRPHPLPHFLVTPTTSLLGFFPVKPHPLLTTLARSRPMLHSLADSFSPL